MNPHMWKQLVEENEKLKAVVAQFGIPVISSMQGFIPRSELDRRVEEQVKAFTEEHDRQCKDTGEKLQEALELNESHKVTIEYLDRERQENAKLARTYEAWYQEALRRIAKFRRILERVRLTQASLNKALDEA